MTYIILSNSEMYKIPEGADPDAVRQMQERRLARQGQPAKAKRRYSSRRTSRREQQYRSQAALTGQAMANLIERVNTPQEIQND